MFQNIVSADEYHNVPSRTVEIIDEFKFFVSSALTVSLLKPSFFAWSTYVFKKKKVKYAPRKGRVFIMAVRVVQN